MALNAKVVEYSRLTSDLDRTQKQSDYLDGRIKEVSVNGEDLAGALNVQVVEAARAEDRPTKPRKALTLAAAVLMGLMLGCGLGLTREWMDQRLRSPEEAGELLGLPVLGVVPHIGGKQTQVTRSQYIHRQSLSDVAEAYRTVRTALFFGGPDGAKTILVTSPNPGDGKSTTASNLAIAMAQAGHRTLLIDCDFRKPVQHKAHELDDKAGLCGVIAGTTKLKEAVRRTSIGHLYVLPCGPLPSNPSEILTSRRFEQVMTVLTGAFDRVVIDSPPICPVADAQILAARADVSILVVRCAKSTRRAAAMAMDALQSVGAQVLGLVVNDLARQKGRYGYYRGYGGYYGTNGNGNGHGNGKRRAAGDLPAPEDARAAAGTTPLPEDAVELQSN